MSVAICVGEAGAVLKKLSFDKCGVAPYYLTDGESSLGLVRFRRRRISGAGQR